VTVPPTPPSEEEIQTLADSLGVSLAMPRATIAGAILSETTQPDGSVIDA
jgi:hypothetical protein